MPILVFKGACVEMPITAGMIAAIFPLKDAGVEARIFLLRIVATQLLERVAHRPLRSPEVSAALMAGPSAAATGVPSEGMCATTSEYHSIMNDVLELRQNGREIPC